LNDAGPARAELLAELEAARFLARASAALAQVADYERTLERIAALAVPFFADWFGVHIRESDGSIRRIAVKHLDPAMEAAVVEMYRRYPPSEGRLYGAPQVIATGETLWAPDFNAIAPAAARDEEHLRLLRGLGLESFICVPMRSRGKVVGALTFATAESGRRYSELHLRSAEDLAARAAIAIENAQLFEALREADRRKDEFLAMLAHELRNPLAPIRNAVEILRAKPSLHPDGQWINDVVDRQVRQMSRLVDDLLDVSRITSGKIELRKAPVTLAAAIAAAVESSRPAIERGAHVLDVVVPPAPIPLDADLARLSQILSNLLDNAAKYSHNGGRITLSASREGDEAVVRVADTGIGIPAEMLGSVFDMFVQVERGAEQSQGGLGIGLTLVKRLVELHGGRVEARSGGRGKGSEFTVRLPARSSTLASHGPATAAQAPVASGKRRVLVVDDNRDAADSLAFLLRSQGNEVDVAYDGVEAVDAAQRFNPDTVLLDIGLPKLYGHEVARRLRESHGPSVLLVAVTGWGQDEDLRRSREAGFDHHLTKPVEFDKLMDLLARPQARVLATERQDADGH
jgi:signal transduction histidine kinase/ActR/RegA family two-component response regulator